MQLCRRHGVWVIGLLLVLGAVPARPEDADDKAQAPEKAAPAAGGQKRSGGTMSDIVPSAGVTELDNGIGDVSPHGGLGSKCSKCSTTPEPGPWARLSAMCAGDRV